jgi:DNA polymerase III delta prime subunit
MDNTPIPPVRRARPIYRVFVSSTWNDLQPERRALMDALNRMEEMRFVGMEFFGNRPDDTHDASIDQVDLCEVFVGIIGFRHGSGISEAEYRRARKLGLPCFVYFKRADLSRPDLTDGHDEGATKLAAFKEDLMRGHTVKEFSSPDELAANATADLHNWVAARWISVEREAPPTAAVPVAPPDADRTNILRLLERIQHDWVEGVLEASLHHRAWLELGLDWKEGAVEHPWDRIVVAPNRPIQTLSMEDSISGVFASAQNTLLVLGEPGAGKTTTLLELARDLIARARSSPFEPAPVVLALSNWTGTRSDFIDWLVVELGLRYQVPKRIARAWLDDARLVLLLDGLDEVPPERRAMCVEAINAFAETHNPPGLAVTCRVAEYNAMTVKLRLRAAICLQPLTQEQILRYFSAAGSGLDHLRQAMQADAGLRELAQTPLMLSVMTMAWGNAPAGGLHAQSIGTMEERRRQLFEAYVQAAIHRRGKSSRGYAAPQTISWLAWLARRMKEHGHTLFAVEQLQPDWLGSKGRQLGYFMATRLMGTLGLALAFLFWNHLIETKVAIALLATGLGFAMGGIDFGFARAKPGRGNRASQRFWCLLATMAAAAVLFSLSIIKLYSDTAPPATTGFGLIYLVMAAFAFCVPLDVRALDVKPTASMRWAWRMAVRRGLAGLVGMIVTISVIVVIGIVTSLVSYGSKTMTFDSAERYFVISLGVTAALVAVGWIRFKPARTTYNVLVALTISILGGQIGGALAGTLDISSLGFLVLEFTPAIVIGVFSGFTSTLIDPARGRRAGAWFWLRVPVLMYIFVGLVMLIPGFTWVIAEWGIRSPDVRENQMWGALAFAAGCGLVSFFRFGGFNGVQHFFLRWLLVRSGNLPPKAEAFYNHAAQLALLQKVGFGYRFIHALLLDHLAARPPEVPKTPAPPSAN